MKNKLPELFAHNGASQTEITGKVNEIIAYLQEKEENEQVIDLHVPGKMNMEVSNASDVQPEIIRVPDDK